MKKTIKTTSDRKIKELEAKIEDLEYRIFKRKNESPFIERIHFFWEEESTRELSLQEKIDLIAQHLGVRFDIEKSKETPVLRQMKKKSFVERIISKFRGEL